MAGLQITKSKEKVTFVVIIFSPTAHLKSNKSKQTLLTHKYKNELEEIFGIF
jgi:hypothetical protein